MKHHCWPVCVGDDHRLLSKAAFGVFLTTLLWSVLSLGGCATDPNRGYSFASIHDRNIRTIAVPIFENNTYYSGLEVRLTEAIIKEIQRSTPWRVVRSSNAATTLSGHLTNVDVFQLSRQRETGLVQEEAVKLTVDFDWMDNRSGETLVSRRQFTALASFVPHRGVGEPIERGQDAAINALARDIVASLQSDW